MGCQRQVHLDSPPQLGSGGHCRGQDCCQKKTITVPLLIHCGFCLVSCGRSAVRVWPIVWLGWAWAFSHASAGTPSPACSRLPVASNTIGRPIIESSPAAVFNRPTCLV